MAKGVILLAAGGTGGHLFPAQALAHELMARGFEVYLATDDRAERFADRFPGTIHVIPSATFGSKNPVALVKAALKLASGYMKSRALVRQLRPVAAVGFGGYPTLPPIYAASHAGVPILLHDANAVMGRANRLLSKRARTVAMGFANATGTDGAVVVTGNPVRPAVIEAANIAYAERTADAPFNLLVFGGSQGAQFFSQAIPAAVALLDQETRERLRIVQQARAEDETGVRAAYAQLGVAADIAPFFADMPQRIANAHYVIARGGASTVSELAVIGRPALLVPYPHALDHDQAMNAAAMETAGGAQIVKQSELSPQRMAEILRRAVEDPQGLAKMAENAKRTGMPDAASRLADCVENIIRTK